MLGSRFGSLVSAEIFQLRKRVSTWVLLGTWCGLAMLFGYIVPYFGLADDGPVSARLAPMLPDQIVSTMLDGVPFFGGAIALILGVMTVGGEFGWDTFKTLFTQRPGRGKVFAAKMVALGVALVPFIAVMFACGAVASTLIALSEDAAIDFPSVANLVQGLGAGWLILATWAAIGVLLAVATRGTSLAIGIGILYSLVIEGLLSTLAGSFSLLDPLVDFFVRANAYSLVKPLGGAGAGDGAGSAATDGPGAFSGPYVDWQQAAIVLVGYLVVLLGVSAWLMRRRDVA
jgi:ABC-type transport system involved in multi-copper enzyme maturation permease subunit